MAIPEFPALADLDCLSPPRRPTAMLEPLPGLDMRLPAPVRAEPGAEFGVVEGRSCCPLCHAMPFAVRGTGFHVAADDRGYEAVARCCDCGGEVGRLRAEADTVFGVREDCEVFDYAAMRGIKVY